MYDHEHEHNHQNCCCSHEHHNHHDTHEHHEHHEHCHDHHEYNHSHGGCGCGCGHEHGDSEQKETLIKVIISGVLLIALTVISHICTDINKFILLALYLVPYLIVGYEVLIDAAKNLVKGRALDENFLMAVATIGAFILSDYPEAVAVMLFFQVGELFEGYASAKSKKSIGALMELKPDFANIEKDGVVTKVLPETVKVGDIIIVKPGEKVPLDGIIIEGNSSLDTSSLTGESMPVDVSVGDDAVSGCINSGGVLKIKVMKEFSNSAVSKIIELTDTAAENSSKSEKFITKFAKVYTPCVVIGAVLLAVIPSLIFGDVAAWVNRAIVFLVVSCPCALVVSVPLCFFMGMGKASKNGVLIKGGEFTEKLAKTNTFIFDKTGTLTRGIFNVTAVHPEKISEDKLVEFAAYGEYYSNHPIAKTIKEEYGKQIDTHRLKEYKEIAGKGVSVIIDGHSVLIGNAKLMDENNINQHPCHKSGTTVHVGVDGKYAGHIVISDTIKSNSQKAIRLLKECGVSKTVMLTGDNKKIANEVAGLVGIDEVHSSLLPEDKLELAKEIMKNSGISAYVGDGINDAPALAAADVGIAMGGIGSDAAIEAADVVIMDDNLTKLSTAVKIAKKTIKKVYVNITFILIVKAAVLVLGALGIVGMWAAVFADVGSLIIAVLNSAIDKNGIMK